MSTDNLYLQQILLAIRSQAGGGGGGSTPPADIAQGINDASRLLDIYSLLQDSTASAEIVAELTPDISSTLQDIRGNQLDIEQIKLAIESSINLLDLLTVTSMASLLGQLADQIAPPINQSPWDSFPLVQATSTNAIFTDKVNRSFRVRPAAGTELLVESVSLNLTTVAGSQAGVGCRWLGGHLLAATVNQAVSTTRGYIFGGAAKYSGNNFTEFLPFGIATVALRESNYLEFAIRPEVPPDNQPVGELIAPAFAMIRSRPLVT